MYVHTPRLTLRDLFLRNFALMLLQNLRRFLNLRNGFRLNTTYLA